MRDCFPFPPPCATDSWTWFRKDIARPPACHVHVCKTDGCTDYYADIKSDGTPDIDLDAVLKDSIPEKTHNGCAVKK